MTTNANNMIYKTLQKTAMIGALVLLTACGDSSKSTSKTPQSSPNKASESSAGGPPSPTTLAAFVELGVSGAIEGIQTVNKQDRDAFFAKNSEQAMRACVTDKFNNDPKYELPKYPGEQSPENVAANQYRGKLTDDNPIFAAIKKYGVKELNQTGQMAYQLWVVKLGEATLACIVQ